MATEKPQDGEQHEQRTDERERRFVPVERAGIEAREDEDGKRMLRGTAAVFYDGTPETEYELFEGVVERIMPGAFDGVVDDDGDTVALFNHNPDNVLGRESNGTLSLRVTKRGLEYDIDSPDTTGGRDVYALVQRGDVKGSSFSFRVKGEAWRKEDDQEVRELLEIEPLYDVGPVTYPAYEATSVSARAQEQLERIRADVGEPPEEEGDGDGDEPEGDEPRKLTRREALAERLGDDDARRERLERAKEELAADTSKWAAKAVHRRLYGR